MTNSIMDWFLNNANGDMVGVSPERKALAEKAREGVNPCLSCPNYNNGECGEARCVPWYLYFKFRWRRIKKMFGMEVEENS